jgi:2-octaprenyl-6-methoxyphenol hydroxylase
LNERLHIPYHEFANLMNPIPQSFKIVIIGTGPVGYAAALGLAQSGYQVALVGPYDRPPRNGRTVAILDGSVQLLDELGVWGAIRGNAAALSYMRMIDDTGSLFRAPTVTFKSAELKLEAFGYNVELTDLVETLAATAQQSLNLRVFDTSLTSITRNERADGKTPFYGIDLESGETLTADIVIGADGKNSPVRNFAGITVKDWTYPQKALTAIFSHERDHQDISTEFHTREGPFTLVPLPGRRSSLVWMMAPDKADTLARLDVHSLTKMVEKQSRYILGPMKLEGQRGLIPMAGMTVSQYAKEHLALIGEAAHVFPPIGAQGLNLGFRDVRTLIMQLTKTEDIQSALSRYDRSRQADVKLRTAAVDIMNRSLLSGLMPVDLARSFGLMAVASIPPLRRFMMQRGAGR